MSRLVRSKMQPSVERLISDAEYALWLALDIVYGEAAPGPANPDDVEMKTILEDETSLSYAALLSQLAAVVNAGTGVLPEALRAAFVSGQVTERGTDRALVQDAIDTAYAAGEKVVEIPAGEYLGTVPISVPSGMTITSYGRRAVLRNAPGANGPVIKNAVQDESGNGNAGITLRNLELDGNKDQQTVAFSVIDFRDVRDCVFEDLEVYGGLRTGALPSVSSRGEGLELVRARACEVRGGLYRDNLYDGIKLRDARYTKIMGATCRNNGRSGIQLAFDSTRAGMVSGDETTAAMYNTIIGVTVEHDTGIPSVVAPTSSGIYFHTASRNTVQGCVMHGVVQAIGIYENSNFNRITGMEAYVRAHASRAAVELELAPCNGNDVSHSMVYGLDGANGKLLASVGNTGRNHFAHNYFHQGQGTGTWTVQLVGNTAGSPNFYVMNDLSSTVSLSLGGGVVALYNDGGALKAKGNQGALTTLAAAT